MSDLVAGVERAYWTLVAAERDLDVRRRNVTLAEQQRDDTQARIDAGHLSGGRPGAADRRDRATKRRGLRLAGGADAGAAGVEGVDSARRRRPGVDQELVPADSPDTERNVPDAASSVRSALDKRPEIAAAMELSSSRTSKSKARATGSSRPSISSPATPCAALPAARTPISTRRSRFPWPVPDAISGGLFQSYATLFEQKFSDAGAGIQVSVPLGNRTANADLASAEAVKRQAASLVDSARLRVTAEVRNAIAAIAAASERVDAARAGREAAEVQLQAELDRFEAGLTINFLVLTRQNDLGHRQTERDRRARGLPSRAHRVRARHRHAARRSRHRGRAAGEEVMKRHCAHVFTSSAPRSVHDRHRARPAGVRARTDPERADRV